MQAPPMTDIRPAETMILYGDNRKQWSELLPLLNPVCRWRDGDRQMVRWEMPLELAARCGIDENAGCANPGCGCSNWLTYDGGFYVDTNWQQTGWFFDGEA